MYCANCGFDNDGNKQFCISCGNPLFNGNGHVYPQYSEMQPQNTQQGGMQGMQQGGMQGMQQGGMQQPYMQQGGMQQPYMQQGGMQGTQQPYMQQGGMLGTQQPYMQQGGMLGTQQPYMQQDGMQGMQQPYMQQGGMQGTQQPYMQQGGMQQPYMQQGGMQGTQQPYMQQGGMQGTQQPYMQQGGMQGTQQSYMQQGGMQEQKMASSPNKVAPVFTPPNAPTFTPPKAPIFTPPSGSASSDGAVCFHHPTERAAGQCARCNKYICRDCVEAYGVLDGEYKDKCLCYDCCVTLVEENAVLLQKQKRSILFTFILTLVGMGIGAILFAETKNALWIIFGILWIGSFWTWVKGVMSGWLGADGGPTLEGFIISVLVNAVIAPFKTVKKIIMCIIHLRKTANALTEDTAALQEMRDYMEYTKVAFANKGVDIQSLLSQNSELSNNSYAQNLSMNGEAAADASVRQATTRIAENGEIIRSFVA